MNSSVSHPGPVLHHFEDSPDDERLRGLTPQQLADRLTWLSWWSPGTFQAVMDYMDFADNLAADGEDPGQGNPDDPAPYCLACGSELGIFTRTGPDWKHYRTTTQARIEQFDPGHAPEVGWRAATSATA